MTWIDDTQTAKDDYELITHGRGVYLQHHVPLAMNEPYHIHPSIEINYLQGCEMDYSFGGRTVSIPASRYCIFWAAQPHRVVGVRGTGKITNAYVSLEEFWSWPLPKDFANFLIGGGVAISKYSLPGDDPLAEQFASEIGNNGDGMSRLHCLELQARITRLALTGWEQIAPVRREFETGVIGGNSIVHFEKMLRFIATHYFENIKLGDVAKAASVSENYANTLFKKIVGITVKVHITSVRVYRARMLLAETNEKIISISHDSGFRSLSSFYEAFQRMNGTSPAEFRARCQHGAKLD